MYGIRMGEPGAQEYYDSIVALYAQWGVDFIKCDDICNTNLYVEHPYSAAHEIEMLQHAIEKCGRDIVLSLSPGPALIEKAWHYETYANMWRITDDFWDTWELLYDMFRRCELWQNHVGADRSRTVTCCRSAGSEKDSGRSGRRILQGMSRRR